MSLSLKTIKAGVWMTAIFCALLGVFTIYYGFTTIYAYSGFTSIFVGVAILLIAIGLTKKHHIARIGAYVVIIISALNFLFWLYIVLKPNEDGSVNSFGVLEYSCIAYIVLSIAAVIFLSLKSTREYFSSHNNSRPNNSQEK